MEEQRQAPEALALQQNLCGGAWDCARHTRLLSKAACTQKLLP